MNIKDKYAIVGIGYTPQGRIEDRTVLSFHTEACANAIMDAGLHHHLPGTGARSEKSAGRDHGADTDYRSGHAAYGTLRQSTAGSGNRDQGARDYPVQ
jgi:acetyl-CoA acetyltransferase